MSIHLESKDLVNPQQMEVAIHGPDGATHLILCTGVAELESQHENFTFCVGPRLSRRQFVGAIASGALSKIQIYSGGAIQNGALALGAQLVSIEATYDIETSRVKVTAELSSETTMKRMAISYHVSILAELIGF